MHIYERGEWKAARPGEMTQQGPPLEGFLHHSDDPDGREYDTLAKQMGKMRAIQRFHMQTRGWSDIAYAYIVFQYVGTKNMRVEPRVFRGREVKFAPAAQLNHNTRTLPICVVGNGESEVLHDETREVIAALLRKHPSVKTFGGHRNVVSTDCPGKRFFAAVPSIAKMAGIRVYG